MDEILNLIESVSGGFLPTFFKGRFLEFRLYHKFADVLPKLSESTFNKKINNCH